MTRITEHSIEDFAIKLLEHLGHMIVSDILEVYPDTKTIRLTLKKHGPALGGLVKYSAVQIQYPEDYQ